MSGVYIEPKFRGRIIHGISYLRCEQCQYMTPRAEMRVYERKWFLGLFHHRYRVCIWCLAKFGVDENMVKPLK